jgi:HK97 family phage portal protein
MKPKKAVDPVAEKDNNAFQMISEDGSFYVWDGRNYKSDIVRSVIRPKAKAIGKLSVKHIRDSGNSFTVFPDVNLKFLLEEPNPLMSMQSLLEKMATQLSLNNNAFAQIKRDVNGWATEIYPLPCTNVNAVEGRGGDLFLKFYFRSGEQLTLPYTDVIHLRNDFNENDIFGDSPHEALTALMEIVNTMDQGIMKSIKNSAVIKWLLIFKNILKPEDMRKSVKEFNDNYLNIDNNEGGAAGVDNRYELEQVKPNEFNINAEQTNATYQRILSFFNTNEKIIQSKFNEDEWNSYYESEIEPVALQLSSEFTRKVFSRTQRGYGNRITFEATSLQYASMKTKMSLTQLVDRSAMSINEMRFYFNMPPVPHGNDYIRRLDTANVNDKKSQETDVTKETGGNLKGGENVGGDPEGSTTSGNGNDGDTGT